MSLRQKRLAVLILFTVSAHMIVSCGSMRKPSEIIRKDFSGEIIDDTRKSVVVILPFRNVAGTKKYPGSALIGRILYDGIMNVVSYFPTFDVPDRKIMGKLSTVSNWQSGVADFTITGEYDLKGDRSDPMATVRLYIWSRITRETFTNTLRTATDTEIFDAVDQLIADIVKVTLKEETKFALLKLENFKVGREKYDVYINRKYLAEITNDNFSLGLKILPDRPYQVSIIHQSDLREVLAGKITLPPEASTNISYESLGTVRIEFVGQNGNGANRVNLDGNDITGRSILTNVSAGRIHVIRKVSGAYSYQTTFYLSDGENKVVPLYQQSRELYDLDRDSVYIQFEQNIEKVKNRGDGFAVQRPVVKGKKGNVTGVQYQMKGCIYNVTESNVIHFWCGTDHGTADFKVIIADRDGELFAYHYRDVWFGNKRMDVPFSAFKPYVWQQSEELNSEIDYPIDSVYFNNGRATISVASVYFNRNEICDIGKE